MRGARPRLGSPPSSGRSAPELRSTVFSYQPVSSPSRSNSVPSKISAMPANDGLRIDEHQRLLPSTPKTTDEYPEDLVNRSNPGSGMLALQHGQLLPESDIFHGLRCD